MDILSRLDRGHTLGGRSHLLGVLNDTSGARRVVPDLRDRSSVGVVGHALGVLFSRGSLANVGVRNLLLKRLLSPHVVSFLERRVVHASI